MPNEVTPSTETVREAFGWHMSGIEDRIDPEGLAMFDRWLEAHDAEVTVRAITEHITGEPYVAGGATGPNAAPRTDRGRFA